MGDLIKIYRRSSNFIPRQRAGKRGRNSWCAFNANIALIFLPAPFCPTQHLIHHGEGKALMSRLRFTFDVTLTSTQSDLSPHSDPDTVFPRRDMGQDEMRVGEKEGGGRRASRYWGLSQATKPYLEVSQMPGKCQVVYLFCLKFPPFPGKFTKPTSSFSWTGMDNGTQRNCPLTTPTLGGQSAVSGNDEIDLLLASQDET